VGARLIEDKKLSTVVANIIAHGTNFDLIQKLQFGKLSFREMRIVQSNGDPF